LTIARLIITWGVLTATYSKGIALTTWKEAVNHYREALRFWIPEKTPLDYARTQQ
jgi:hypothetical protein